MGDVTDPDRSQPARPEPPEANNERLLDLATRWAIGDDYDREHAVGTASDADLEELAHCLDDVPQRFWDWLAGPESFSPQPSENYVRMSVLVEAVDSARSRLRRHRT